MSLYHNKYYLLTYLLIGLIWPASCSKILPVALQTKRLDTPGLNLTALLPTLPMYTLFPYLLPPRHFLPASRTRLTSMLYQTTIQPDLFFAHLQNLHATILSPTHDKCTTRPSRPLHHTRIPFTADYHCEVAGAQLSVSAKLSSVLYFAQRHSWYWK